jgi:hypothetical protein
MRNRLLALQQRLRVSGAVQAREGVTDLISDHMIDSIWSRSASSWGERAVP